MFRPPKTFASFYRRLHAYAQSASIKDTLFNKPIDKKLLVQGWVQAIRKHKDLYFVDLVDGSCLDRLQIVIQPQNNIFPTYGSSIKVLGTVVKSAHKGQEIELVADSWDTHGLCDESYPFINRQKYSSEYIRQFPHLRSRTRRFSSILRIRNHASMAVHKYFQEEGFCFVHTPIITQNDCEGAGEVFSVDVKGELAEKLLKEDDIKSDLIKDSKGESSTGMLEHFFGAPAYLTVSGQFHLESLAGALSRVYNFGPTFRAESSRSRQHASEFQMIEAEISFVETVEDLMKIAESCIKKIAETLIDTCSEEIDFITNDIKNHRDFIENLLSEDFIRLTYHDAIDILQKHKDAIKNPITFGDDIASEHKKVLVNYFNGCPVFVSMFPSEIKPFYMKCNENHAHCFDLFAAYGGEICGGSIREHDEVTLKEKFSFEKNPGLSWYLDLRKYGTVPHGGFGIGFERLLQSLLGISNIRDVLPFPRRKNDCKC